jgi:hypothetical protein
MRHDQPRSSYPLPAVPERDAPYCGVVRGARPASARRRAGLPRRGVREGSAGPPVLTILLSVADMARRAALARRGVAHLSFPIDVQAKRLAVLIQCKTELYPRNRLLFMGLEVVESAGRLHVNVVSTDLDRMG